MSGLDSRLPTFDTRLRRGFNSTDSSFRLRVRRFGSSTGAGTSPPSVIGSVAVIALMDNFLRRRFGSVDSIADLRQMQNYRSRLIQKPGQRPRPPAPPRPPRRG